MLLSQNIDFIAVGLTIVSTGILGFLVFFNNKNSSTNRAFLLLSLFTIFWSVANYLSYQSISPKTVLWMLRLVMFCAIWYSYFVFKFLYVFPEERKVFSKIYKFGLVPVVALISFLALTPFIFESVQKISSTGGADKLTNGHGIISFGILVLALNASGIYSLIRKMRAAENEDKLKYILIFAGIFLTISLIVVFNFILPAFFNNPRFIPLGAVFTFPFVGFTAYAIFRHRLFNVKIISTELLTFIIWIFILFRVLVADSLQDRIMNGGLLLFTIISGIFLIRSVLKEVRAREEIEELATRLEFANLKLKQLDEAKSDFISIASHQLRTPLTAIKGYASMVLEGSYGEVQENARKVIDRIFQSSQRLIAIITDFLDISHIEQGTMQYELTTFDMRDLVKTLVEEFKSSNEKLKGRKALKMIFASNPKEDFTIAADHNKIRQVVSNLIDNSIKYTLEGYVEVSVEKNKESNSIVTKVMDSGIGISPETMPNLFKKFSRAKGSANLYANGSGLGLYVASEIMKAHKGKIWAESEGEGKGSQFFVELPGKM